MSDLKDNKTWDGVRLGDCLEAMRRLPDDCVDMVFCSPPYEAQRTYGIGFDLKGQGWVDWSVERYVECCRISRGLVAWVVEGYTKQFRWSASPALLMADLHRAGVSLRKPPVFHRVGVPGSGGPDWWRNDYEFVVCASPGRLPWSDNTATGAPPKWAPDGQPSHRMPNGRRVNQLSPMTRANGKEVQGYTAPKIANPGNVTTCKVGGGRMGSKLAHENEAPFPESLAKAYVRSFCPPGGIVFDPFAGSGTTLAVAIKQGRRGMGCDVRDSQVDLSARRVAEAAGRLANGGDV